MDTGLVWLLVAVAVIALISFFAVRAHKAKVRDLATLSPERLALHEQCVAADKALREEERKHQSEVARAQRELRAAQKVPTLATLQTHSVTPLEVNMKGHRHPMSANVAAQVDSTGDVTGFLASRSTVTRMATGAVLFGGAGAIAGGVAKKQSIKTLDTRELFVMVVGDGWAEVVKVPAQQGESARQFAASVNSAAVDFPRFSADHTAKVQAAESLLAQVQGDTALLEEAKRAREVLGPDPLQELRAARKSSDVGQGEIGA
ncbi:hypothetical protein H5398_03245 [Tessaracoccus sp. MC1679]|uniref:hypothetical protein n=1 Tax=Tessaracoccus sp. MC1679 TaxID=2760313 RepID=UPI001603E852|nr:hypothetical protein [Tessaracoccus sp. MC1679]MBB1514995.1 hypothetical protein [Tessaracoccus sp. MC1679]